MWVEFLQLGKNSVLSSRCKNFERSAGLWSTELGSVPKKEVFHLKAEIRVMADVDKSKVDVSNRRALRPGEWACVDARCAHINAEKRHSCEICGKAKPKAKSKIGREIGKDAAEKSKGLFSAEDWVCTKCGNVNWARRNTCNVCNAPKLADLEIRTGYGGGYMDRQDVEYKDRRDDEEEFDEFGRKKKRRNLEYESSNAPLAEELSENLPQNRPEPEKVFEEDDDDEDEESDDVDLDKYDLTADPELIAFTAALESSKAKNTDAAVAENRPPSPMSSDCSCSCSGGNCSCIESEEEEMVAKKSRNDRAGSEKRRSVDRDRRHNNRDRRDEKDRKESRDRDESIDKTSANRNKDRGHRDRKSRERSRERRRSRERDHHR